MDLNHFLFQWFDSSDKIKVFTSGSTGEPKTILLEKEKMRYSARQTCHFLGLKPYDIAFLCLPLDYIAGKMMVVRAETCQLRLISVPPSSHPLERLSKRSNIFFHIDFAAMVPLQVANSLKIPAQKRILQNIKQLIIGGGAIDPLLEDELKDFPHTVWSTYGMTETISHIALRRINGKEATSWYEPFQEIYLSSNKENCLQITAPNIIDHPITTNDIVEFHSDGRKFKILGRKDNVICSGGIKIQIETVENILKPVLKDPFAITKHPHPDLGECVVIATVSNDLESVKEICNTHLPRYWKPKDYIHIEEIPLTPSGKIARKKVQEIVLNCF